MDLIRIEGTPLLSAYEYLNMFLRNRLLKVDFDRCEK